MNLYGLILKEMSERQCAYVSTYVPFYISSIGAHLLNLVNKSHPFHYVNGLLWDIRAHPFLVAPPGFGKTFWMEHFIDPEYGLIHDTTIKCDFRGYMTEAAWVGQVKWIGDEAQKTYGIAKEFENGIVGVDEFSAVVEAMKTQHSKQLDPQLLSSLDKGRVIKSVGPGTLNYRTQITLWCGTQTLRLDLSSGMGRRLCFMTFFPTEQDKDRLREIYLRGHNVRYNPARLRLIRKSVIEKQSDVENVEHLSFTETVKDWFRERKVIHFDIPLYERVLVGYNVMRLEKLPKHLVIDLDDEGSRLIKKMMYWRNQIKRGGRVSQIIQMLLENGGKPISLNVIRDRLVDIGLNWRQSSEILGDLQKSKIIRIEKGFIYMWKGRKIRR